MGEQGSQWVTGIGADGTLRVWRDGALITVDQIQADDHNAPAIATHARRPPIVFYTEHNRTTEVAYRVGFGARRALTLDDVVTYVQALAYFDRVVVLIRVGGCHWQALISNDWAESWGEPVDLLAGCSHGRLIYMTSSTVQADRRLVRLAVYGHPTSSHWRTIKYGLLNLQSGDITVPGAKKVANIMNGDGLPLRRATLMTAYNPPAGWNVRLFDVGEVDGDPLIAYAHWERLGSARYATARFDRAAKRWINSSSLPMTGGAFWEPSRYFGGATINDAGRVILSRNAGGMWLVEAYVLRQKRGWVLRNTLLKASEPHVRPYAFRGGAAVAVLRLHRYADFRDYQASTILLR
jgi:hypothetical protein